MRIILAKKAVAINVQSKEGIYKKVEERSKEKQKVFDQPETMQIPQQKNMLLEQEQKAESEKTSDFVAKSRRDQAKLRQGQNKMALDTQDHSEEDGQQQETVSYTSKVVIVLKKWWATIRGVFGF